jgi:hypothetical protein
MPKSTLIFTSYPDSSSQIRGQGKIATTSSLFAIKKFSIYKEGALWKAGSHRQNVVGYFTLKVPKAILSGKKHYVYRFDVNEVQESAECHQIAVFSELPWALEYMNTEMVVCEKREDGLCPHNAECKQIRPLIVDPSKHWEVGYFVISNKKLIVCEHTYRYTEPLTE